MPGSLCKEAARGLLLWRQTRNQVFQDDIRKRKEEGGKDIVDLHRCPKHNFLAAVCSSSFLLSQMRNLPNLINFDFKFCFGNDGLLLIMVSSSLWKQATANDIQDDNHGDRHRRNFGSCELFKLHSVAPISSSRPSLPQVFRCAINYFMFYVLLIIIIMILINSGGNYLN